MAVSVLRFNGFIREVMLLHHILRTSKTRILHDCQYKTTSYPSSFSDLDNAEGCEHALQIGNDKYKILIKSICIRSCEYIWNMTRGVD